MRSKKEIEAAIYALETTVDSARQNGDLEVLDGATIQLVTLHWVMKNPEGKPLQFFLDDTEEARRELNKLRAN